jgi:hypothetical protein
VRSVAAEALRRVEALRAASKGAEDWMAPAQR